MPKVTFTHKPHRTRSARYWRWRHTNQRRAFERLQHEEDHAVAEEFADRARSLRDQLEPMLHQGFNEGIETVLTTVAEQDMTDFSIMVDLAEPVSIEGVEPLPEESRAVLERFLEQDPWHSLAIDHDIYVALALLDSVGTEPTDAPIYRLAPGILDLLAKLLASVNQEQLMRFVGEYEVLANRDDLHLPAQLHSLLQSLIDEAAARLGVKPPRLAS